MKHDLRCIFVLLWFITKKKKKKLKHFWGCYLQETPPDMDHASRIKHTSLNIWFAWRWKVCKTILEILDLHPSRQTVEMRKIMFCGHQAERTPKAQHTVEPGTSVTQLQSKRLVNISVHRTTTHSMAAQFHGVRCVVWDWTALLEKWFVDWWN